MASNRKNFQLFDYIDDNAVSWNKRGEDGGAAAAVDGHTPFNAANPVWENNRRMQVRRIIYMDPLTFRTISPIFYTSAAYDAVALGDVLAVQTPGATATTNYAAAKKVPEKQPARRAARQLAD